MYIYMYQFIYIMEQNNFTESHKRVTELLKEHGFTNYHGGIQLFANQYDKDWAISINFNGTGLHISKEEIDEEELTNDELINVYKSWTYRG